MNSRAIAFVVGVVGAAVGILALVLDEPVAGLIAGLLALSAGALSLGVHGHDTESDSQLAAAIGERDALREQAAGDQERLRADGDRIAQLKTEVAAATSRAEDAEAAAVAAMAAAQVPAQTPPTTPVFEDTAEIAAPSVEQAPPGSSLSGGGDMSALTDQASQLFSEAYFRVALDARIASARRHLRPVAIALIDAHEGVGAATSAPADPARAAQSIRETVRDADTACRLTDGTFAIILEDTPENGAVWTVERVRRNLVSRFGSHTMWAGVACYPAHAFSADELLEQASLALGSAREWKQDRIEVAISE
ncbi:MAG: diguanylate cyclase [Microthrixaceae bacterium]